MTVGRLSAGFHNRVVKGATTDALVPIWRVRRGRANHVSLAGAGPHGEGLGYSTLYGSDHLDAQFGPLVAMTVAAEATSTLHVGSSC